MYGYPCTTFPLGGITKFSSSCGSSSLSLHWPARMAGSHPTVVRVVAGWCALMITFLEEVYGVSCLFIPLQYLGIVLRCSCGLVTGSPGETLSRRTCSEPSVSSSVVRVSLRPIFSGFLVALLLLLGFLAACISCTLGSSWGS